MRVNSECLLVSLRITGGLKTSRALQTRRTDLNFATEMVATRAARVQYVSRRQRRRQQKPPKSRHSVSSVRRRRRRPEAGATAAAPRRTRTRCRRNRSIRGTRWVTCRSPSAYRRRLEDSDAAALPALARRRATNIDSWTTKICISGTLCLERLSTAKTTKSSTNEWSSCICVVNS